MNLRLIRPARSRRRRPVTRSKASAGANQAAIPRGRKLGAGRYRLTMTVTDALGNSATSTKSFRVKARKKKH